MCRDLYGKTLTTLEVLKANNTFTTIVYSYLLLPHYKWPRIQVILLNTVIVYSLGKQTKYVLCTLYTFIGAVHKGHTVVWHKER